MRSSLAVLFVALVWLVPAIAAQDSTSTDPHGGTVLSVEGMPRNITFEVKRDGTILWNGEAVSCPEVNVRFRALQRELASSPRDMLPCDKYPEPRTPDKPN